MFKEQIFDYDEIASRNIGFLRQDSHVIALDGICWKFGKSDINILFLSIVVGKMSLPIHWQLLNQGKATTALIIKSILGHS
ncbi:MAG: hypothetical protein ACIPMY_02605 [Rickettsia endosymbiont of Pentastiridius leporinus]